MSGRFFVLTPIAALRALARDYVRSGAPRTAAALAYYLILSLFPFLLCLSVAVGRFHLDLRALLDNLQPLLPGQVLRILEDYLDQVACVRSPAVFWAGLATLLYSGSTALRILLLSMDELYRQPHRGGLGRVLSSVALSALFLLTVYLSVAVIFTGRWFFRLLERRLSPSLLALLPLAALERLWPWIRYLLLFCFVLMLVLSLYRLGTPPQLRREGTVLWTAWYTALAMVVCSGWFSWLIGLSTRYDLVYGSLASLVILLVWLYFCCCLLLLGAVCCRNGLRKRENRNH